MSQFYFPNAPERNYEVIGYLCHYKDEPYKDYLAQLRAVQSFNPRLMVFDRVVIKKPWRMSIGGRPSLRRLAFGLMPGDVVVISSLDRLGANLAEQYRAFRLLARNEIRVHDMDPTGEFDWRPAWERGLDALVRRNSMYDEWKQKVQRLDRCGKAFLGVGYQPLPHTLSDFVPFEPGRLVARRAAELSASGMSDEAVASKLVADGVPFLGAARNDIRTFTPELVRLCVDAVQNDWPWPVSLMTED